MTFGDQAQPGGPEGDALFDGSQADEQTAPAAPQQPTVPPELISAVTNAVAGELRTVHGELRRQQQEFQRLAQLPRTPDSNGAIGELSARLDDTAATLDILVENLLPDEQQRQALKQQRELRTLRRQVAQAQKPPEAPPPPAPAPAPVPDTQQSDFRMQAAIVAAQAAVASYAEGLDINLQSLSDQERTDLAQGVDQNDLDKMVSGLKQNLRKMATARADGGEPPPEERQAQTRAQVRQTATAPTGRGPTGAKPATMADAERALAEGRITVQQFRQWGFR